MAKDGTCRGGARIGSGRKRKGLDERLLEGSEKKAKVMLTDAERRARAILKDAKAREEELKKKGAGSKAVELELVEPDEEDAPEVSDYLTRKQKDGSKLLSKEIFKDTWKWLKSRGCEKLVPKQIVEQYSLSVARWIQCEEMASKSGMLGKHPTTGNDIASPYVAMSRDYKKQMNADWFLIWQIVKENSSASANASPDDDTMERLLSISS